MDSIRLNPLDAAWIFTESRATPNHVGGLLQFRLPEDAPQDFLRRLMADFRGHRDFRAPWNRRLKIPFTRNPLPAWVEDDDIDLEYHVRHAALPWPGGERELGELVGRLQSTPLDLSRPPWECTIIEGLDGDRFAHPCLQVLETTRVVCFVARAARRWLPGQARSVLLGRSSTL